MPLLWGPGAGGGSGTAPAHTIIFMSACGDATLGLQEWPTVTGTVSVDGTIASPTGHTGPCRIKCDGGAGAAATVRKPGVHTAAGRRFSVWINFAALPTT